MNTEELLQQAIDIAIKGQKNGGGPFGAVIAKDGEPIVTCHNQVTNHNDPTAHAEVEAIRQACQKLNTFDLSGYDIYCSCEPCPMCLAAIYWARLGHIYYACTKEDAKEHGFDDSFIYEQMALDINQRKITQKTC